MQAITTTQSTPRLQGKKRVTPQRTGTPDPRPVTDYTVAVTTPSGNSRVTITLAQPCIIRNPAWGFVACDTGAKVFANSMTVIDNRTFRFDFLGVMNPQIGFIDVPYQDTQVQNFQGGFVRSGGQWFRAPVGP
jgi:hypothetical protein